MAQVVWYGVSDWGTTCCSQFDSNVWSEAQASVRSRQSASQDVLGFLSFLEISENGERVGTIIARLAVRLGDVWVTLVKTSANSGKCY